MFIYAATTAYWRQFFIWKIGCTGDPNARNSTFLTGCPPGMTPSCDMVFDGLWETTAIGHEELEDIEERVHDHFLEYRMQRERPGDSEWFNFRGLNAIEELAQFFACAPARAWIKRRVPQEEIRAITAQRDAGRGRFLNKMIHKNFRIIKNADQRLRALNEIQTPVVAQIRDFIASAGATQDSRACYIVAPCGSGKTVMVCKGIHAAQDLCPQTPRGIIICAPTNQIQVQWHDALIAWNVMSENDIHYVGDTGTTNPEVIKSIMSLRSRATRYCILSTYASSKILTDIVTSENTDLVVLDEAHHMVGKVAQDKDSQEGITRTFMSRVADLNIRRISLTYTPRFIRNDENRIASAVDTRSKYLSMDDERIFGRLLVKINLRTLISRGILPDYYVWSLYDRSRHGTGMCGKAECLLEAWRATEMMRVRGGNDTSADQSTKESQHILHHLIIFTRLKGEAEQLEKYFRAHVASTDLVLRAESGAVGQLQEVITRFNEAPRAILINCFVLSEGVDIPRANAVAIMYPKHSYSQIVQMILRAGRWALGKSVFHVLISILDDEDMSGYEAVLSSLASDDERIYNEIIELAATGIHNSTSKHDGSASTTSLGGEIPEHIILEEYESTDIARIKERFTNIRRTIFTRAEIAFTRRVCAEHHIDTSVDYAILRANKCPELPEDPRMLHETWYDFLHSGINIVNGMPEHDPSQPSCSTAAALARPMAFAHARRMTSEEFARNVLIPNGLRIGWKYDEWRIEQPNADMFPSTQHINDGYFGNDIKGFTQIVNTYMPNCAQNRRSRI